jgi:histidinol-phosphate phosphatase family protein
VDRDGTLIYDSKEHLFLGSDNDWKRKVQILPYVVEGLRLLKTIPNVAIFMITNQPGVAILDFSLLTLERAHEVCKYVVEQINSMGGHIDDYFLCPHVGEQYVAERPHLHFDKRFIVDCTCTKPHLGMVFDALEADNVTRENAYVYVIGDRSTDVETALNIGGVGILVPSQGQPDEIEKTKYLVDQEHTYTAKNFREAADFIIALEKKNSEEGA